MKSLRRFLELPAPERHLLIKAVLLLVAIRLGLAVLPFRTLRRLLAGRGERAAGWRRTDRVSPDRIAWAVMAAGRYAPGRATCLVEALAVEALLARRGYPARLRVGVAREEDGRLQAHAWVESGGRVVIGGSETALERYTSLLAMDAGGS